MKFICRIVGRRIIESNRRNRRIVDYDETRFDRSSESIVQKILNIILFHFVGFIFKKIFVVSFTIIMIICNYARCFETRALVLKLVFVLFIWARDIVTFRPLAGVWQSAIACQHKCNVYYRYLSGENGYCEALQQRL